MELTNCHTKDGVDVKCSLSQTGEAWVRMCYLQDQWHIVDCSGWQRAQA